MTLFLNWLTNKLSDLTRVSPLWVNFRKCQFGATNIFCCKNKIKLKRLEPTAADRGSCASIPVRYSPPQPSYSPQAHTTHNQLNTPRPKILWEKNSYLIIVYTVWSSGWCWLLPVTTKHPPQHTILRTNFTLWEKNAAYALSFIQNNQETPPTLVAGIEWIPISISQKQLSVFVSLTSPTANSTPKMQLSGRFAHRRTHPKALHRTRHPHLKSLLPFTSSSLY